MKTLERLGTQNIRQLLWEFSVPAVVAPSPTRSTPSSTGSASARGGGRDAIRGRRPRLPLPEVVRPQRRRRPWRSRPWASPISVLFLMLMPVFGITQGMQPIIGYNAGA
jgi:hypothetical protein